MGDGRNVVEIVVTGGGGESLAGSGYHLGGGLVLTAAHVATVEANEIAIRTLSKTYFSGQVAWKAGAETDIALIQAEHPFPRTGDLPLRWGLLSPDGPEVRCELVGYRTSDGSASDLEHVVGTVNPLTGARSGLLAIALADAPTPRNPSESAWRGMSGAPVWADDILIAFVVQAPTDYQGRRLMAVPVSAFANDLPFVDIVTRVTGQTPILEVVGGSGGPARGGQQDSVFDVFLSYANPDIQLARRMDAQFSQAGLRVYFAERLLGPGGQLFEQLSDALRRSKTFVAIVGANFSKSDWPMRELAMAQQRPPADYPPIIPVVIGDAEIPSALAAYQTIRLTDPADDAEFSLIVAQIIDLVRGSGSAADTTVSATETPATAVDGGDDGAEVNGIGIWGYRDRPAKKDALKRQKMVEVIAAMLSDGRTTDNPVAPASADPERRGPTVLALEGAWGTGKTTMMDHIEAKLDERRANTKPISPPPPRRLRAWRADLALSGWPRWSKIWDDSMRPTMNERIPATVRFEPWTYQTGEQVWAGLATTLLDAAKETIEWHPRARERYWFQRNAERLDAQQLQRSLRRRILSPLFRVGVFALIVPIVAQLARVTDTDYTWGAIAIAGVNVALLIPTILLLAALLHTAARLFRPVATMLPTELFQQPVLSTTLSPAAIPKSDPALRDPYYRAQAGYLYLLQHDVFDVLHDIGHELIVFIDDLDRCSAKTTADVFEAINMFLTRHFPTTRFVLGLDAAAVVAHLDDAYSALANQKQIRGDADPTVGWSYLRKLIQLQIPVPGITQELVPDILASLLNVDASSVPPAGGDVATDPSGQVAAPASAAGGQSSPPPTVATVAPATAGTASSEPVKPANVQTLERDENVRALLTERVAAQPNLSVREAKRLLSTWQFYVHLVELLAPMTGKTSVARARHLVILAEILTRWPASQRQLLCRLGGEHGLVVLARSTGSEADWARALAPAGLGRTRALESLSWCPRTT